MLTPDQVRDVLAQHKWRDGEREVVLAEVAERKAERENSPHDAESYAGVARPVETAHTQATRTRSTTNEWTRYIKAQLDRRQSAMSGAIADLLAEEQKARQKLEAEHIVTRQELAAVKQELAELRGEIKVRGALSEMTQRLDKIEQARPPLRTVGTALRA